MDTPDQRPRSLVVVAVPSRGDTPETRSKTARAAVECWFVPVAISPSRRPVQTLLGHHWHHLPASEVAQLLDTDPEQGLDQFTLADRQNAFRSESVFGQAGPRTARALPAAVPPAADLHAAGRCDRDRGLQGTRGRAGDPGRGSGQRRGRVPAGIQSDGRHRGVGPRLAQRGDRAAERTPPPRLGRGVGARRYRVAAIGRQGAGGSAAAESPGPEDRRVRLDGRVRAGRQDRRP